ncbi:hypothetical protein V1505DRAFT_352432 [Lipomyces doorenjongii]
MPETESVDNAYYDLVLSQIRICFEHCDGYLKGRFQCLKKLRIGLDQEDFLMAWKARTDKEFEEPEQETRDVLTANSARTRKGLAAES